MKQLLLVQATYLLIHNVADACLKLWPIGYGSPTRAIYSPNLLVHLQNRFQWLGLQSLLFLVVSFLGESVL